MNRKKIEIILNIVIVVLALILAIVFAFDSQWLAAAAFTLICILNAVGVYLRIRHY